MARKSKTKLGDRELDIMQILWKRSKATIGEVHKSLLDKGENVAYTTIQTMLNRLELKGYVKRQLFENINHYYPLLKESEAKGKAVKLLKNRFFRNSTEDLIIHLVKQDLDDEQLERIQEFIDNQRRKGEKL